MTDHTAGRVMTLRRAIVGRRQWRQQLWILGLALVAVGLVLVVDGLWVAGVPLLVVAAAALWLCGAWVIAGTRDAYVRRLMRLWRSCATETRAAYDGFRAWEHSFSSRIRALTPPDGRAAEHERLVVLAEEEHRVRGEGRPSTEDARAVAETHRAARAIAAELGVSASGDDRSYVTSLQKLFDERDDKYASAAASVEHATASVIQKLTAIKAPGSATAEHDRLAAAFRAHLKAQRELHAAVLAADPDLVTEAAAAWESSVGDLRDAFSRVTNELDFYDRWPGPAVTLRHSRATVDPHRGRL